MQLRYLKSVDLKKATREKQPNGTYIETLTQIASCDIQKQDLNDDVSVSIYGADIIKILRIHSIKRELEAYLETKVNNEEDNISKYYVILNGVKYKIKSVRENWVDIEATGTYEEVPSI
jgi:hypothetical protein